MVRKTRTAEATQEPTSEMSALDQELAERAEAMQNTPEQPKIAAIVQQVANATRMPETNTALVDFPPKEQPGQHNGLVEGEIPNGHAAAVEPRKPLPVIHGSWRDNEVGVRKEEDFKNKLTTILFREKPPEKAQELLIKSGYRREGDRAFSKPIDYMRRREHREAAENLVLEVDNLIREAKGLEKRESYYISRS